MSRTPDKSFGAMCVGKHRHATERQARDARRHFAQRFGDWMGVYPCRHCGHWHVGHGLDSTRAHVRSARAFRRSFRRIDGKRRAGRK